MSGKIEKFATAAFSKPQLLLGAAALLSAISFSTFDANANQRRAQGSGQTLNLTAKGSGPVKDTYCGGPHHVKCDIIFQKVCKLDGGVLSPSGTICWNKNVW